MLSKTCAAGLDLRGPVVLRLAGSGRLDVHRVNPKSLCHKPRQVFGCYEARHLSAGDF